MSNHTCACAPNNEHFWFQNHSWYTCLWVYKCTSFPSNCMPRSTIITSFHSGVFSNAICSLCVLSLSSLQGQIRPCSSTSILSHYFFVKSTRFEAAEAYNLVFTRPPAFDTFCQHLEHDCSESSGLKMLHISSSGVFVIKHVHCHASHFGNFWIWTSFWNRFLTLASFKTILKRNTSLPYKTSTCVSIW